MAPEEQYHANANRLALIGVPSSAGARRTGQEQAPAAFRAAGLLERLRARGLDVADLGDLPVVCFRPDPEHPRQQNLALVAEVARRTAERVADAVSSGRLPVVLGGDCSLSLGVVSGLLRQHPRLGLLYFDGDLDLNTPDTTPSGALDGMVLAHLLGRGAPELAGIGPRQPLLSEADVALFGYDPESHWIDPPELALLETSRLSRHPAASVRADAAAAARDALRYLGNRSEAFLVHFDVDVTQCPAADVPHPDGLTAEAAFAALRAFVAAAGCAGLVVTELNPQRDPDGSQTERLVHELVEVLATRRERAA